MIIVLTGCAEDLSEKTNEDLFYDVQKKLNKMDSYSCEVEITSMGNKEPQEYVIRQWFKKPNKYKLKILSPQNLKGKITISDGKKAWIYHPAIRQVWQMQGFSYSQEKNMFLGYFLKNCLNSENATIESKKVEGQVFLIIETEIPGGHIYYNKERLWINAEDMKPKLLEVFDTKGDVRIKVKYNKFEYNTKFTKGFFKIDIKK